MTNWLSGNVSDFWTASLLTRIEIVLIISEQKPMGSNCLPLLPVLFPNAVPVLSPLHTFTYRLSAAEMFRKVVPAVEVRPKRVTESEFIEKRFNNS